MILYCSQEDAFRLSMRLFGKEVAPGFICSNVTSTRWEIANFWSVEIQFSPITEHWVYDPDNGQYHRIQMYETVDLDAEIGKCKSVTYPAPAAKRHCGEGIDWMKDLMMFG